MAFPGFLTGRSSFAETTSFDEFVDNTLRSTTSDVLVEYRMWDTEEINGVGEGDKETGIYILEWSFQFGNTKGNRTMTYSLEQRLQGNVTWIVLSDLDTAVPSDDDFALVSGFKVFNVTVETVVEFRLMYGKTTSGGSAIIKNANFNFFKVGELP